MRWFSTATMFAAAMALGMGPNSARAQHEHEAHEHAEKAGHSHEKPAAHGGAVTMSKEFHIETVFLPNQIRLYLYDRDQNPMHVKHWEKGLVKAAGVVEFRDPARETAAVEFVHGAPGDYVCASCCGYRSRKPGKCGCGMKLTKEKIPEGTSWSCPMHPGQNGKGPGKCSICGMDFTLLDYLVAEVDLRGLSTGDAKATFNLKNLPGNKEQTLQFSQQFVRAEVHGEHKKSMRVHGDHGS